jgi:hypothetical protein
MNKLSQQPLWERIKSFDFDDSSSHTPFSQKLAHQNKWTEQFARQAIDEYQNLCTSAARFREVRRQARW